MEADQFIRKALNATNEVQEQLKILSCLDRQGKIKRSQVDINGALVDLQKSLGMKLRLLGENKLNVSKSYYEVGQLFDIKCKYDQALYMYKKSLNICLSAV